MVKRLVLAAMLCVGFVLMAQEGKTQTKFGSARWKQVRVTSDVRASDGCKNVGSVYATDVLAQQVHDALKRQAAAKLANLVVLTGSASRGTNHLEASGEAYVCPASDPVAQAVGDACDEKFSIETNLWKSSTYKSSVPYPTLDKSALVTRLVSVAAQHEMRVLNSDVGTGTVTAEINAPRNKKLTYEFVVSDESPGSRVEIVGTMPGLLNATQNDELRNKLCEFMSAAASTAGTAAAQNQAASSASGSSSVEERLKKLDSLLEKKLITKDEYAKKRAAILKDL